MTPTLLVSVDGIEVWHGDCLDPATVETVLQGRRADLLHFDAPYSDKTHDGHAASGGSDGTSRRQIEYASWSPETIADFSDIWLPHVDGWATTTTDHVLAPVWSSHFEASDRYVFPPLPWVEIGSRVRLTGDGPSSWTCWTIVARPRHKPFSNWGTLRGAYVYPAENHQSRPHRITGGKSLRGTCELLADYAHPRNLVLDPTLGGGTTAIACRLTGRRCIGIELDPNRAELSARLVTRAREQFSLHL